VAIVCIPGQRDDGRDSAWFDAETGKRVRQPACIKCVADKLLKRAARQRAKFRLRMETIGVLVSRRSLTGLAR